MSNTSAHSSKPKSTRPNFHILLLVAAVFIIGIFWNKIQRLEKQLTELDNNNLPSNGQNQAISPTQAPVVTIDKIKALFKESNLYFGDKNSDLLFVEVGDPSCPFCQAAAGKNPEFNASIREDFLLVEKGGAYVAPVPEMKKLVDQGKAAFVYIYFPGHGTNGEMAMKALYCAHEQGKFWQVHDLLMTNKGYKLINEKIKNDKTKSQELASFLAKLVNASKLKKCLDSGKYDSKLIEDRNTAMDLGVRGTPGFFINTAFYRGAYSWTNMERLVTPSPSAAK